MDLHIEYLPLSELRKHPRNPKSHDIGELQAAYSRFGYVSPIIIDEKSGRMVAGHGRVDSLMERKERGAEPPKRVKVKNGEWLVPVVRGVDFETEKEAEAYLLADNRIGEIGGWIEEDLRELLKEHENALEGIGFDLDDLEVQTRKGNGGGDGGEINGEIEFSEELFEASNYVVLYFDNEVDWLQALSVLGLKKVGAKNQKKNVSYGIGRVLNGAKALNVIKEAVRSGFL